MQISELSTISAEGLAPILLAALQRLGELGCDGAVALARLIDEADFTFDEAADWIAAIADGELND